MDIKKQNTNFSVEQLLRGKLNKEQFKVDFGPLWHYLDNLERKVGGFNNITMQQVLESVYEFATISVSLDKADYTNRVDQLNEANLKLFIENDSLKLQNETLKQKVSELSTPFEKIINE